MLHKILKLLLLRYVKSDVEKNLLPSVFSVFVVIEGADLNLWMCRNGINIYTGLTEMQHKWCRSVLGKDIDAVNGACLCSIIPSATIPQVRIQG